MKKWHWSTKMKNNLTGIQDKSEQDDLSLEKGQRRTPSMDKLVLIIVGLLIVGGAAYLGLRRLVASAESSNVDHLENSIRAAFADAAANHLHTSVEEIQKTLTEEGSLSILGHRLRDELLECRVFFNPPVKNVVLLTLLISWKDGQIVKIEQNHEWETLPENVRAALIRTRHSYEALWSLPTQNGSSKEQAL